MWFLEYIAALLRLQLITCLLTRDRAFLFFSKSAGFGEKTLEFMVLVKQCEQHLCMVFSQGHIFDTVN
jgi:hypothetical protein